MSPTATLHSARNHSRNISARCEPVQSKRKRLVYVSCPHLDNSIVLHAHKMPPNILINVNDVQEEEYANLFASTDGRVVIVDASLIFTEDFSLARILKLADLRARDICCFSNLDRARLTTKATALLQPVNLESHSTCPKLQLGSGEVSRFHTVPICVLSAMTAGQLAEGESPGGTGLGFERLLSRQPGSCVFGLQVSAPWSAEVWQSRAVMLSQRYEAAATTAAMPRRFKQADKWDYSMVKKVHPVYATSSQQIGCKKPCQHDMQSTWAGTKGGLAEFGPPKRTTSGLKTAMRTSKVHQSMDGWC